MNSREKGKRGERELAGELRRHGYDARRGQQYCGANGDADVVGLPGLHIECKRVERLDLYAAMSQAEHDAPVVHGRWGEYESFPLTPSLNGCPCSVCKTHFSPSSIIVMKYCPNCGAKMDGGDDND